MLTGRRPDAGSSESEPPPSSRERVARRVLRLECERRSRLRVLVRSRAVGWHFGAVDVFE
jgi:hypothetical protein